jgi:hypothetical protein
VFVALIVTSPVVVVLEAIVTLLPAFRFSAADEVFSIAVFPLTFIYLQVFASLDQ